MGGTGGGRTERAYDLGIDLGTTYTAAAVRVVGSPGCTVVPLAPESDQVPSVMMLDTDGVRHIGEEAERRASAYPERVVREYKRRLGDDTPMVVAGTSFLADGVAAETIRWTADRVVEVRGSAPRRIAVAHPAGWGAYRRRLFADAMGQVGLPDVVLVTEPEAAAVAYGADGRIPEGQTVAVYDLGGGTFDAAVVRGRASGVDGPGVEVLGQAQGLDALGGVDFDEALFWHVCAELGGTVAALDPADRETHRAVARLRRACVAAKEALSSDTEAVVEVDVPGTRTRVRITRSEFEEMIEPALWQTVDVLREVLDGVVLGGEDVDRVLLVGGSSRIPLVSRVLAQEFGCPVSLDPEPTTVVARGAALAAERGSGADHMNPRPLGPLTRDRTPDEPALGGVPTPPRVPTAPPVEEPLPAAAPVGAPAPAPHELVDDDPLVDPLPAVALDEGPARPHTPERPAIARSRPSDRPRHAVGEPDRGSGGVITAPAPATRGTVRDPDLPARPPVRIEDDPDAPGPASRSSRGTVLAVVGGVLLAALLVVAATVPIIPADDPAPPAPTRVVVPTLPPLPASPAPRTARGGGG